MMGRVVPIPKEWPSGGSGVDAQVLESTSVGDNRTVKRKSGLVSSVDGRPARAVRTRRGSVSRLCGAKTMQGDERFGAGRCSVVPRREASETT